MVNPYTPKDILDYQFNISSNNEIWPWYAIFHQRGASKTKTKKNTHHLAKFGL